MVHPGAARVAGGEVGHAKAHVAGKHRHRRGVHARLGLFAHRLPLRQQRPEGQHALEGEAALQPRGHAAGHLRGLDGDGARAAARVEQWAVLRPALPAGGCQHGRGQGLLQRRFALDLLAPTLGIAPAALEQRLARGVGKQRGMVEAHVQHEWQVGVARVHAGPLARGFAHHVAHGVLDAQRGEIHAAQRAALCIHVRAKCLRGRDPVEPGHASRQVVEVVLVAVRAVHQRPQHALSDAALQVQSQRLQSVTLGPDAAAPGLGRAAGQALHLLGQQGLGAAGRRQEEVYRAVQESLCFALRWAWVGHEGLRA